MIDKDLIKSLNPCIEGLDDYTKLFSTVPTACIDVLNSVKKDDAIWLIARMSRKQTLPDYVYTANPVKYHEHNRKEFIGYLRDNWPEFLDRLNSPA